MPEEKKEEKKKLEGLFIPAGFLIGFGVGFLVNNIPAGMFIGLGAGFLFYALVAVFKK